MNDLVIQKKNVVMDSMQPGGGALTVFAIPVKQKSYKGFDYCAIAISYNNEDMEQVLDVSAFSDKSDCYVSIPTAKFSLQRRQRKNSRIIISLLWRKIRI